MGTAPHKIDSIQAMRAAAAWIVVIGHTAIMSVGVSGGNDAFRAIQAVTQTFFHSGVDMFFVISGAIMFIITRDRKHESRLAETADFLLRRVVRIYPLFWITLVFALLAGSGQPVESFADWVKTLLLIDTPPQHNVAWTLLFEIRFYLIVAVVILLSRRDLIAGFAIAAVGIGAGVFFAGWGALPSGIWTAPLMLEFLLGLAVGCLFVARIVIAPRAMLALGLAWWLCTAILLYNNDAVKGDFRIAGSGVPAALILYGAMTLERLGVLRFPRFAVVAGDASYSVYLWHFVILAAAAKVFTGYGVGGAVAYIVACTALIATVGYFSFRLIERPLMRLARQTRWRSDPKPRAEAVADPIR
jgi:exopolysaccharide production protein ExoZ